MSPMSLLAGLAMWLPGLSREDLRPGEVQLIRSKYQATQEIHARKCPHIEQQKTPSEEAQANHSSPDQSPSSRSTQGPKTSFRAGITMPQ